MARRWPDTLPLASEPGFGLEPADPALRTDMEVGMPRVRRLTFARNDGVDLVHIFSDTEMGLFRAWWEDAAWSLTGDSDSLAGFTPTAATITADTVVGPDEALADRLVDTAVTSTHFAQETFGSEAVAGATILCRATIKAAGRTWARLSFTNRAGTVGQATVDLTSGLITATANTLSATIESRGNGWWRVTITAAVATGGTTPLMRLQLMSDGTTTSYLGDGVSGVDILEQQARMVTGVDGFLRTDAAGKVQGAAGGTGWVFMPLAVGGGFKYLESRFKAMFKAAAAPGLVWTVTSQLEVR